MTRYNLIAAGACIAAIAAATVASAETMIRVRNDSDLPATIGIDKKSRDVRPRKAANFPFAGPLGVLTVGFANGDMNRADLNPGAETLLVENAPDGNSYYCMTLDTEDFEFTTREECAKWVEKLAKKD